MTTCADIESKFQEVLGEIAALRSALGGLGYLDLSEIERRLEAAENSAAAARSESSDAYQAATNAGRTADGAVQQAGMAISQVGGLAGTVYALNDQLPNLRTRANDAFNRAKSAGDLASRASGDVQKVAKELPVVKRRVEGAWRTISNVEVQVFDTKGTAKSAQNIGKKALRGTANNGRLIAGNTSKVKRAATRLGNLGRRVGGLAGRLGSLAGIVFNLVGLLSAFAILQAQILSLRRAIGVIRRVVTGQGEQIDAVGDQASKNAQNISKTDGIARENKSVLDKLKGAVDRLARRLRGSGRGEDGQDGLDGKDADPAEIQRLKQQIQQLQQKVNSLKNGTDGKDGVDGKDGKDADSAEIQRLKQQIQQLQNKVNSLKDGKDGKDGKDADPSALGSILSRLSRLETVVAGLMGLVGLGGLISSLRSRMGKAETDINNLKKNQAPPIDINSLRNKLNLKCRYTAAPANAAKASADASTKATNDWGRWMQLTMWADMKTGFNKTLDRLGPLLPNGGISSWLQKFGKSGLVSRAMNALTLIATLHNAAHLSTSLVQTLGDALSVGLAAVGIKDEQDNPIDINSLLGQAANSFMANVVGPERWNDTKEIWQQFNRTYQAAANLVYTARSIGDSTREITEWTAEQLGKFMNAAKRDGVVGFNAFPWMPEQISNMPPVIRRLEGLGDTASSLQMVASEAYNVVEEAAELATAREEFLNNLQTLDTKIRQANQPVEDREVEGVADSQSPPISPSDFEKE